MILMVLCGIALIVSMGLPGAGGGRRGAFGGGGSYVAKVGKQEVSVRELEEDIQRRDQQIKQMFGAQFGGTDQGKQILENIRRAQLNPDKVLDELVQRKILLHIFDEQGLQVSSSAVRGEIERSPYFQKDGVFDVKLYKERVTYPAQFESYLRDQLKGGLVLEPFAFGASLVTEGELALQKKLALKTEFETVTISADTFKDPVKVDESEVQAILKDESKTAELQAVFNRNIKEYNRPEEVSARHILIKGDDAEKKIKEIETEIKSGKITFADAAKKYSADQSNAKKGGELGFFSAGVMDKTFEAAAFGLKKENEISAPVKSSFGWHLVQLVGRHEAIKKTFADVKPAVAREYAVELKQVSRVKEIADSWVKAGGPKPAQLKAYNLTWQKLAAWDASSPRLGTFAEKDIKVADLLALSKSKPLLNHALPNGRGWSLVRFVAQKEEPVTPSGVAFKKSTRILDLYFERYKKGLEQDKKIQKSEKILAQVKQAYQL